MTDATEIPAGWYRRADESADEAFYAEPRFVAHIDQATIDALTEFYREFIPEDAAVLDLMSSWISHLPQDIEFERVTGLGMNLQELEANPQLSECCVHNLNDNPVLPYAAGTFDRVLIAVSVQYLIQPVAVMRSIREVLRDGGAVCIAMSHRLFPTKAIAAFQHLSAADRVKLVGFYLDSAGFKHIEFIDRSPAGADPLWLVTATA